MPKCILYNADIYDSSPVTGKEFEILQKNNITPNYLLNRKGTKKCAIKCVVKYVIRGTHCFSYSKKAKYKKY